MTPPFIDRDAHPSPALVGAARRSHRARVAGIISAADTLDRSYGVVAVGDDRGGQQGEARRGP